MYSMIMEQDPSRLLGWHIRRIRSAAVRAKNEPGPGTSKLLVATLTEADTVLGDIYPRLRGEIGWMRSVLTEAGCAPGEIDAGIDRLQTVAIDILTGVVDGGGAVRSELTEPAKLCKAVLVIGPNGEERGRIAEELRRYTFEVDMVTRTNDVTKRYGVTILDIDHVGFDGLMDHERISNFGRVIAISVNGDFGSRLNAVRIGASRYFVKPVDVSRLAEEVYLCGGEEEEDPLRVLIVDASDMGSVVTRSILEEVGMKVESVRDPEVGMYTLDVFRPDIALIDYHLPKATGPELAAMLRHHDRHAALPIVYLAGERDIDALGRRLRGGGEALLSKDAHLEYLVTVVRTKAERYRTMRDMIVRDSMTGLYNHTATRRLLEDAVMKAESSGEPMSYAMLDIDHFKHINDGYGHHAGDMVIKGLAMLLRRKVRRTDIVGRYGGEEFAVLMPGAGEAESVDRMEEIRESFAELPILSSAGNEVYRATFSCGIAVYPRHKDADEISFHADKALYDSKHGGRNMVTVAR